MTGMKNVKAFESAEIAVVSARKPVDKKRATVKAKHFVVKNSKKSRPKKWKEV